MPHLIDGHNLIGKLRGIALSDLDDEQQLMALLGRWCQRSGKRAVVYFDQGSLLGEDPRPQHGLTAHFVAPPKTADMAIHGHLQRLGRRARNWTVVSSDRAVQRAARQAGARVVDSERFSRELEERTDGSAPEKPEGLTPTEIDRWLDIFRRGRDDDDR
ncbi:MAG: NYN domain-containing protein [Anaerolineales bacterium]